MGKHSHRPPMFSYQAILHKIDRLESEDEMTTSTITQFCTLPHLLHMVPWVYMVTCTYSHTYIHTYICKYHVNTKNNLVFFQHRKDNFRVNLQFFSFCFFAFIFHSLDFISFKLPKEFDLVSELLSQLCVGLTHRKTRVHFSRGAMSFIQCGSLGNSLRGTA